MTDYECPDEFARLFANLAEAESFGGGELITVLATDGIKPNAIPAISRALCSLVEHRLNREREGTGALVRRGLAVSPSLINDLAFDLVKACNENKIPPPPELCKLLELQLGVRKRGRSHSRRGEQFFGAAAILARAPETSLREVARRVGVAPSTVLRWHRDNLRFKRVVNVLATFDPPGS